MKDAASDHSGGFTGSMDAAASTHGSAVEIVEFDFNNEESSMMMHKLAVGSVAFSIANVALAGQPLGASLGVGLGQTLGSVLGFALGSSLPIAGAGLLTVAAVSLVLGIRIVRRKQNR